MVWRGHHWLLAFRGSQLGLAATLRNNPFPTISSSSSSSYSTSFSNSFPLSLSDFELVLGHSAAFTWLVRMDNSLLAASEPGVTDASLQNMTDEEELCSTQPIFNPKEDVSVDTLKNLKVNEVTLVEDYWRETSEEREIKSEEDQPLVSVQPPTLPCTFSTPYKGVEVTERSQIFYFADTFVLDDPDAINSFMLEVPNELLNLKEGVHASLPRYVVASFVVDISKGEGIT
ncbi:hypothetical protein Syun_006571 [Stephania yunnanensis]|uniref:Uncharacterized protein n=1 Tax=Stephania yunnanensis TaxID=152371 RepID=A0AAP0KZG6_9MAGN